MFFITRLHVETSYYSRLPESSFSNCSHQIWYSVQISCSVYFLGLHTIYPPRLKSLKIYFHISYSLFCIYKKNFSLLIYKVVINSYQYYSTNFPKSSCHSTPPPSLELSYINFQLMPMTSLISRLIKTSTVLKSFTLTITDFCNSYLYSLVLCVCVCTHMCIHACTCFHSFLIKYGHLTCVRHWAKSWAYKNMVSLFMKLTV